MIAESGLTGAVPKKSPPDQRHSFHSDQRVMVVIEKRRMKSV